LNFVNYNICNLIFVYFSLNSKILNFYQRITFPRLPLLLAYPLPHLLLLPATQVVKASLFDLYALGGNRPSSLLDRLVFPYQQAVVP